MLLLAAVAATPLVFSSVREAGRGRVTCGRSRGAAHGFQGDFPGPAARLWSRLAFNCAPVTNHLRAYINVTSGLVPNCPVLST
jgi:hypothetical protein